MPKELPQFVHLHVHSHYSMLDGMGKLPNLIKKAKADGQTAIALTDHGVMYGAIEFYEECERQGMKPIIGVEAYVAPRTLHDKTPKVDASPFHLILLAKNEQGYKNLLKLTSIAHLEGYYYKPRIDKEILKKYSDGLIATTACIQGEVPRKSLESIENGRLALKEYLEIFTKDNLYLEVQKHNSIPACDQANKLMFQLAEEFDLKVIATNDPHYVDSDDAIAQDVLICLQTGRTLNEENRMSMMSDDYSLLTREQMFQNFPDHPEVMTNTLEVADKCHLHLDLGGIIIPDFPVPDGHTLDSYFREKCYLGLNWRYGTKKITADDLPKDKEPTYDELYLTKEIWERYLYEYGVIDHMGYQGYLLIVADYVQWAKDQGIAVGPGRGSGAGSIITYCFNITNLDPLQFNLLFERFLNPDRISMPDIDMDFADSRRSEVIEYVCGKYGRDHVAQIITFGTMAARMAVRDVGRVLSMTYSEVDVIAKLIQPGMKLQEALENIDEIKSLYNSDAKVRQCLDIAKKLEGVVRHSSMHAAGVVISKEKLTEYCPLQEAQKGDISTLTQYPGTMIEHLGLLKMDFLGLSNLTIIQNALRIIKKTHEVEIDIDNLPIDDKEAYELLARGDTTGVFQLESDGMKRYLKELKPTVFEDIIAMVALYRPGPMQWIDEFIARKHGRKPVEYVHEKSKESLKNTYGIIVYQEQVMQISKDMAGFTGGQADTLRKAMGKKIKELMDKMGKEFIDGCVKNNVSREIAENLFKAMQDFAQYAFNKSHAACYAMIAYQTAYLKAHYPSEFMAALMTSNQDDLDKLAIDINECEKIGVKVLPPLVNESFEDFGVVKANGNVRFGLSAIKNVGYAVGQEIVKERKKGPYVDFKDFLARLSTKVINKKSLEALAMSGALDDMGDRNVFVYNMEKILEYSNNMQKMRDNTQTSLFGNDIKIETADLILEDTTPCDKKQRLVWERELLGMYVSDHPLSDIGHVIETNRTIEIKNIRPTKDNEFVRISGIITTILRKMTRNNQNMAFVKIEDMNANIEVIIFPKVLERIQDILLTDKIVAVDGFISYKDGAAKILAENIVEIGEGQAAPKFETRGRKKQWGEKKESFPTNTSTSTTTQNNGDYNLKPKGIEIQIPSSSDRELLLHLKEIFAKHAGESEIYLKISDIDGGLSTKKIKSQLDINPVSQHMIENLVGKENIKLKYS
ncbi:MAG: DNA polymerase III subunit alpha [bacterium]